MIRTRFKLVRRTLIPFLLISGGCVEPNYRSIVTSNGEGNFEIRKIPIEHTPAPAHASAVPVPASSTDTGLPPAPALSPDANPAERQQQIEKLQARDREIKAEIDRLKSIDQQPPTTAPTAP